MAGASALLILVAVLRIISTYATFGETWDEPAHLAAGMEWWELGTYTHEYQHPPLARIALAAGPYLDGVRPTTRSNMWVEGRDMLDASKPSYRRTLSLARLGILPFFVLAAAVVWYWTRRYFGAATALAATALFTTLPEALAHGGLATTDMTLTASFALALLMLILWLERPSMRRAVWAGGAIGLALLSKMSALLFLPLCAMGFLVWRWRIEGKAMPLAAEARTNALGKQVVTAALVTIVVIWAGYRFSFNPLEPANSKVLASLQSGAEIPDPWREKLWAAIQAPVYPLTEYAWGIFETARHNQRGHKTYLLGEAGTEGWWYYFPIVIAVKLPIAFLILSSVGAVTAVRTSWRERKWQAALPAISAVLILLAVMPSQINIGARHILPMFLLMAILAGLGTTTLLKSSTMAARSLAILLVAWQFTASAMAHPDYLAYFNEAAGGHPERIVSDSSLDWAQDRNRLADVLRARQIDHINLLLGAAPLANFPSHADLEPYKPVTGWVAVSMMPYTRGGEAYRWLEAFEPVAKIGKSIRLYEIPEGAFGQAVELPVTPKARQ